MGLPITSPASQFEVYIMPVPLYTLVTFETHSELFQKSFTLEFTQVLVSLAQVNGREIARPLSPLIAALVHQRQGNDCSSVTKQQNNLR